MVAGSSSTPGSLPTAGKISVRLDGEEKLLVRRFEDRAATVRVVDETTNEGLDLTDFYIDIALQGPGDAFFRRSSIGVEISRAVADGPTTSIWYCPMHGLCDGDVVLVHKIPGSDFPPEIEDGATLTVVRISADRLQLADGGVIVEMAAGLGNLLLDTQAVQDKAMVAGEFYLHITSTLSSSLAAGLAQSFSVTLHSKSSGTALVYSGSNLLDVLDTLGGRVIAHEGGGTSV